MTEQHKPCPDWISLIVVIELGVIGTLLAAGLVYLSYVDKEPNAALYTLAGGAIGALGAMLTNTHRTQPARATDTPTGASDDPVTVTAPPGAPVSVVETPPATATTAAADLADVPTMAVDDDDADEIPLPSE